QDNKFKDIEEYQRTRVLEKSVPVLTMGVQQDREPELRRRCAETLARIAPVARNAVSALTDALEAATCEKDQKAVLEVIKALGPEARDAAPLLHRLAKEGKGEVSEVASAALRSIHGPRWIGVNDRANLFSQKAREHVNDRIAHLSDKHNFHFVAETVRSLPADYRKDYQSVSKNRQGEMAETLARKRGEEVGATNGVYVLICSEPPIVQVQMSDGARKDGPRLD